MKKQLTRRGEIVVGILLVLLAVAIAFTWLTVANHISVSWDDVWAATWRAGLVLVIAALFITGIVLSSNDDGYGP